MHLVGTGLGSGVAYASEIEAFMLRSRTAFGEDIALTRPDPSNKDSRCPVQAADRR
jgi:hypothetical protein